MRSSDPNPQTPRGRDDDPQQGHHPSPNHWRRRGGYHLASAVHAAEIEWQLRYGDPESVRLAAASIVSAYIQLTMNTTAKRTLEVRRLIREAEGR